MFDWWEKAAMILVIVGAIAWGLIGLFDFNPVAAIAGSGLLARVIYILVGVAGVAGLWPLIKN